MARQTANRQKVVLGKSEETKRVGETKQKKTSDPSKYFLWVCFVSRIQFLYFPLPFS
jgi:hypothetical protein